MLQPSVLLLHLLDNLDILWEISAACLLLGTEVVSLVKVGFIQDTDTVSQVLVLVET